MKMTVDENKSHVFWLVLFVAKFLKKLEKTSTTFGYIDNYREKYKEMTNVKKKFTKVI